MYKKEFIIAVLSIIAVLGIIFLPKYFQYRDSLKQEVEELPAPQKSLFENFSLPPPPATSTVIEKPALPKPVSPAKQQEAQKRITLPPPPTQ